MSEYSVIGTMSGSSLDGLDLCASKFKQEDGNWSYQILRTETLILPESLKEQLHHADTLHPRKLLELDAYYGAWVGEKLRQWIDQNNLTPGLISIHGHTVFHEPEKKYSLQIGSGEAIAEKTGLPVVDTFRTADILKGGQGAPLVPAGEHYLLSGYDAFLNLGGIANLSVHKKRIMAWDIAPCNQVLNHFAEKLGMAYDESGKFAASGSLDRDWLNHIRSLSYFLQPPPKSLANQWTLNILKLAPSTPKDGLHTYCHFLAKELAENFKVRLSNGDRVLVTGGGTFNNYLIALLRTETDQAFELVIPSPELISFKEALVFGFLGLLKMLGQINIFHSVTGAKSDSIAGVIHSTSHTFFKT